MGTHRDPMEKLIILGDIGVALAHGLHWIRPRPAPSGRRAGEIWVGWEWASYLRWSLIAAIGVDTGRLRDAIGIATMGRVPNTVLAEGAGSARPCAATSAPAMVIGRSSAQLINQSVMMRRALGVG